MIHNSTLNSEDSVSSTSSTTAPNILCFKEIQELGRKASLSEPVTGYAAGREWYRWNNEYGWEDP